MFFPFCLQFNCIVFFVFSVLMAGILPFGAVFIELFFIFTVNKKNQLEANEGAACLGRRLTRVSSKPDGDIRMFPFGVLTKPVKSCFYDCCLGFFEAWAVHLNSGVGKRFGLRGYYRGSRIHTRPEEIRVQGIVDSL